MIDVYMKLVLVVKVQTSSNDDDAAVEEALKSEDWVIKEELDRSVIEIDRFIESDPRQEGSDE